MSRLASLACSAIVILSALGETFAADRPNFLLVFTDDQRYDSLSCAGHPFAKTPNIDRVASEGAYCRNSFVAIPLCAPSRASFQTGQYPHTHGVMRNNGAGLRPDAVTFPKLLQKAGYQTAYCGKWHQEPTDAPRPGFDYWVSYKGQGIYSDPPMNINGERIKGKGYIDDLVTDKAIEWMTKGRDMSKPFSLTLAFKAVHGPFTPPDRDKDLYSDAPIVLPPTNKEPLENKPAFIRGWLDTEITRHMQFPYDVFIRNYNRTIRGADDNLGRVLKALEDANLLDDTCVIFTSDNGYYQGEHGGLFDKRSAYEESIRVPMVVRYPKRIKAGTKIDGMVLNIDIASTFLEYAGVPVPASMQGRSMVGLLGGKAEGWRKSIFVEYFREKSYPNTPTLQAVRTDRYKYVRYLDPVDKPEVYDLERDPLETKNLHDEPAAAPVLKDLRDELDRLIKQTAAPATGPSGN